MKSMMRGLAALLAASMTMPCAGMFPATAADDAVKALPLGTYEVEDFDGVETWTSVWPLSTRETEAFFVPIRDASCSCDNSENFTVPLAPFSPMLVQV